MKKTFSLLAALALTCTATTSSAAVIFGSHVNGGLLKHFDTADSGGTEINVTAGLAFDPTHTDVNGNYDRVYLANRSADNAKRGLYSVDIFNETSSSRLALAGDGTNDLDKTTSIIVDANGDVRAVFDVVPSLWKVTDPSGTPTETQMIGNYEGTGDDDPNSIAFVPTGFGGDFAPGVDIIMFDQGIDDNNNEGALIVDGNSTVGSPISMLLFSDGAGSSGTSIRGDSSNVDGYGYFARTVVETADLAGTVRPFINRFKGDGILERVFLDIDAGLFSTTLDDVIQVNPRDGSVWLSINETNGDKSFYRVDVVNASDESGGDFLAGLSLEISHTGTDAYNVGSNSMAFSPDGKFLVMGASSGIDSMYVYQLIPEPATWVLLSIAGLVMPRRRAA